MGYDTEVFEEIKISDKESKSVSVLLRLFYLRNEEINRKEFKIQCDLKLCNGIHQARNISQY